MTQQCWACRSLIGGHQNREGEGRCRDCDAHDFYEEDHFDDVIKVNLRRDVDGETIMIFHPMIAFAQERLRDWLVANIPRGSYSIGESREEVTFRDGADADLAQIAFA
jgi:hypothetical protein